MTRPDTRERILDAAEQLFAERGVEGASFRSITSAADVNLAAIHYHYGSRGALLEAVLQRRLAPVNQERLERLEALEAATDGRRPVPVEAIMEAFVDPAVQLVEELGERGILLGRLLSRIYVDTSDPLREVVLEQFAVVLETFRASLARSLPGLPPDELLIRLHFSVGTLSHALARPLIPAGASHPFPFPLPDLERGGLARELVAFLAAGLRGAAVRS